jgi:predicted transcriptional regulator of viral defense system
MTSRRNIYFSSLNEFPYFKKELLSQFAEKFSITKNTLNSYIYKSLKDGEILRLKRNYYVTRFFYEKNKTDTSYIFLLSNILLEPSYISLESALQYYGLFAEAVNYIVTSVTLKLPRVFKNRTGRYSYRKINEKLFSDFQIIEDKFNFTIARPYKAIFDYLYYHTNCFTKNVHEDLLEELRIDTNSILQDEKKKLKTLIAKFTPIKIRL